MKKYLTLFVLSLGSGFFGYAQTVDVFSSFDRAKQHPLLFEGPAPDFFQGALLGNGGMGVVVTTRPDAVVLRFGHNDVWDIRIAENHRSEIGNFETVFKKISTISDTLRSLDDDPWYTAYSAMAVDNYMKPYPRPFPCGSVILGFDPRKIEMLGYTLDISNGLCTVKLLSSDKEILFLKVFVAMDKDVVWMRLIKQDGTDHPNVFSRIRIMPDPSTPTEFPRFEIREDSLRGQIGFRQTMPYREPDKNGLVTVDSKDRAFRLGVSVNQPLRKLSRINWDGNKERMDPLESGFVNGENFFVRISLEHGLKTALPKEWQTTEIPDQREFQNALECSTQLWKSYWNKSGVSLGDRFLEELWYRNLYFLNCAAKDDATCPGLFANWSFNDIGTAWHGDYHLNYNVEQPFWVTFSSNHLEKDLPYVHLIHSLLGNSRTWAKEYYGLPGAYFPHTAYPVDMTMNPYPVPTWGWEVSETPWAVQNLWWHYLYSGDRDFLKDQAFAPIRDVVAFLVSYMRRPDAHGGSRWVDDKYHIFPTVPPELYGLRPAFRFNYDCAVDLTLTRFIFNAFSKAVGILGLEDEEKDLLAGVKEIMAHFPAYPTAVSSEYGKVLVSVPGEQDQMVYNVPIDLISVFPGEDYGLHSDPGTLQLLKNTFLHRQNEGGNDLVFKNLQAARIGMLDLEKFKRQVRYSLLPDGTATDRVMQVHGRYNDKTDFDFMSKMGIWFENFSLPVVVNECLLQSYDDTLRFFPNWPMSMDASFNQLRAAGGFLVSARLKQGVIERIEIRSEAGNRLNLVLPWHHGGFIINNNKKEK